MDWVDRPQNYTGFVVKFATFARLQFGQFSTENSSTWHGSLSVSNISVQIFRFFTLINIKTCPSTLWWPMRAIGKSSQMTVHSWIFLFYF